MSHYDTHTPSVTCRGAAMATRKQSIQIVGHYLIKSFAASLTLSLLAASIAHAETYGGIGAMDTLGDIRQRFPGATFERLNPAWAQAGDVLYSVTGDRKSTRLN